MTIMPWLANYDGGVPHSIQISDKIIHEYLQDAAEKHPDNTCTIFKGAQISYKEMNDMTDSLAAGLHDLGIKKGDRVRLYIPNTPQFVIAYFTLLKIGAIVVATNTHSTGAAAGGSIHRRGALAHPFGRLRRLLAVPGGKVG